MLEVERQRRNQSRDLRQRLGRRPDTPGRIANPLEQLHRRRICRAVPGASRAKDHGLLADVLDELFAQPREPGPGLAFDEDDHRCPRADRLPGGHELVEHRAPPDELRRMHRRRASPSTRNLGAHVVRETTAESQELGGGLDVERRPHASGKPGMDGRGVGRPPAHLERFDQPEVSGLIESQRGRPPLGDCDRLGPVASDLGVSYQALHRAAQMTVQPDPFVLDPSAEPIAADVLRAIEEVALPAVYGAPKLAGRDISLEGGDVQFHGVGNQTNGFGVDLDPLRDRLLELE